MSIFRVESFRPLVVGSEGTELRVIDHMPLDRWWEMYNEDWDWKIITRYRPINIDALFRVYGAFRPIDPLRDFCHCHKFSTVFLKKDDDRPSTCIRCGRYFYIGSDDDVIVPTLREMLDAERRRWNEIVGIRAKLCCPMLRFKQLTDAEFYWPFDVKSNMTRRRSIGVNGIDSNQY